MNEIDAIKAVRDAEPKVKPRDVACSVCGAAPGQSCADENGNVVKRFHGDRRADAELATIEKYGLPIGVIRVGH